MGNASYSIYLVHNPLLSVTQRLADRLALGWLAALVFGVVISVLAGLAYYRLIERPALGFFRNRFNRRPGLCVASQV
jgi:peptidoglycan/LPS O-acetylase OafA/YrhL